MAFAYVERILSALKPAKAAEKGIAILKATLPLLRNVGFQKLVFEDFYDVLESLLNKVATPDPITKRRLDSMQLLEAFQSPEGTVSFAKTFLGR